MEVTVKSSGAGGKSFTIKGIESSLTVLDLKKRCAEESGLAFDQQRLFLKGRLLKDDETLDAAKVPDKATLFLVKGAAPPAAGGAASSDAAASAAAKEEKQEPEEPLVSVPCVGGCGFFGTSKTQNYCSKCYAKKIEKEKGDEKKKDAPKEEPKKEGADVVMSTAETDAASSSAAARVEQTDKTKCWTCTKKCGLTGFECKCGYVFCAKHRHAEEHECDFDHKGKGREILAKNNPNISCKGGDLLDGV